MARKKRKVTDKIFRIGTKDPKSSAKDFMKTVKSGKGNFGKSFFKV